MTNDHAQEGVNGEAVGTDALRLRKQLRAFVLPPGDAGGWTVKSVPFPGSLSTSSLPWGPLNIPSAARYRKVRQFLTEALPPWTAVIRAS